jgi:AcrR family transcriptional regulator
MKSQRRNAGRAVTRTGDREAQIIESATRMFQERGYDATTIQAIADDVGILKGSLYYYIDSKDDLLFRIIEDVHRGLGESVANSADYDDPLDRIRAFVEGHVRFCAANMPAIRVFLHDFRALSEDRKTKIVEERDEYNQQFRELVVAAGEEGLLREDLDIDLVVLAVFGMMNWMYQWYRPGGRKRPEDIGRTFADLVVQGLRA